MNEPSRVDAEPGEALASQQEPASGVRAVSDLGESELLHVLDAAVCVFDAMGTITYATERASSILRVSLTELRGSNIAAVLAAPEELCRMANGSSADEGRQKLTLPRHADTVIGYRTARIFSAAGEPRHAVVFQDITSWERLRDERDRLMRLAAVSEVLPSILHELKNPLAAIGTAVELLVEECKAGSLRDDLHSVLTEIRRMSLTLEGVGSVGRELRSQKYAAVDHAILQTAAVLTRQASERGIKIQCDVPALPVLKFDVAMVRAILFNLLTNAIHACSSGDEIAVSAKLLDGGQTLSCSVRDTGAGMTPEIAARCRELFYTTKARGTGIGLALCDRAVTAAGGSMRIDSVLGQGTDITLLIPTISPRTSAFAGAAQRFNTPKPRLEER